MKNLEAGRVRPLMDIALPRLTSSSTSGSQTGTGTSRLKELYERLQSRDLENAAREVQPPTCREYPVRSVVISSYKKNTDGAYHRHNREDWTAARSERRDAFNDASWARGQPDPSPDENPSALASGNLEFFWCVKAADVGIPENDGDGEDLHFHPIDGHQ